MQTATLIGHGDGNARRAHSLATALMPFCSPSRRMTRYYPRSRSSRAEPGPVASRRRTGADQPAAPVSPALPLAWPAGMPSFLWASAWADVTAPPADDGSKGVIWGHAGHDRNDAQLAGQTV